MLAAASARVQPANGTAGTPLLRPTSRTGGPRKPYLVAFHLMHKYPGVFVMPLLLLAACLGLGIWGVINQADQQEESTRSAMRTFADSLSLNFTNLVQPAFTLAISVGLLVARGATDAAANSTLLTQKTADVILQANMTGLVDFVFTVPEGRVAAVYLDYPNSEQLLGMDTLAEPVRTANLHDIQRLNYHSGATGMRRVSSSDPGAAPAVFLAYVALFLEGPPSKSLLSDTYNGQARCPAAACYNLTANLHWWGFVGVYLNFQSVVDALRAQAAKSGAHFSIVAPADFLGPSYTVAATASPAPADASSVSTSIGVENDRWTLYVAPAGGWDVPWRTPAIVGVVVGSLLLAAAVMTTALYRAHYNSLLESLLPKEALSQMIDDAKRQGLLELELAVPGTTADLILNIMTHLLQRPIDGVALSDVVAIQTALRSSANIYTPLWEDGIHMEELDDDVASSLAMALGAKGLRWASEVDVSHYLHSNPDTRHPSEDGSALGDGADGGSVWDFESMESTLNFIINHAQDHLDTAVLMLAEAPAQQQLMSLAGTSPLLPSAMSSKQRRASVHSIRSNDASIVVGKRIAFSASTKSSVSSSVGASLEMPIIIPLDKVLAKASNWQFDAFELNDASAGHPLSALAYYCITSTGLAERLGLKAPVLCRWLMRIEAGYSLVNPYHNATHAADVLQTMHVLLTRGGMTPGYASSDLVLLACYMAAIIHDYGHIGCTNDFLITTAHDLAIEYNDRVPMENMHISRAWAVLKQPAYNFISHFQKVDVQQLRRTLIDLVLATDMKQHFSLLGQFNAMHSMGPEVLASTLARPGADGGTSDSHPSTSQMSFTGSRARGFNRDLQHSILGRSPPSPKGMAATSSGDGMEECRVGPEAANDAERLLGLQMAIKCADLAHTSTALSVHLRWVTQLEEEFFRQGDAEKACNVPLSPLFDRSCQGVSKSQVGFYEVVVLPLYSSFSHVFPEADALTAGALKNFRYWRQMAPSPAANAKSNRFNTKSNKFSGQSKKFGAPGMASSKFPAPATRFRAGQH